MIHCVAAWEVSQFFNEHDIPYAVIGGLAVQEWGGARLTVDADFTIAAPLAGSAEIVQLITAHFPSRIADPQATASRLIFLWGCPAMKMNYSAAQWRLNLNLTHLAPCSTELAVVLVLRTHGSCFRSMPSAVLLWTTVAVARQPSVCRM